MVSEDQVERAFAQQDKQWNGPRFFQLGIVTLLIAIGIIYYFSSLTGCRLLVVP